VLSIGVKMILSNWKRRRSLCWF